MFVREMFLNDGDLDTIIDALEERGAHDSDAMIAMTSIKEGLAVMRKHEKNLYHFVVVHVGTLPDPDYMPRAEMNQASVIRMDPEDPNI